LNDGLAPAWKPGGRIPRKRDTLEVVEVRAGDELPILVVRPSRSASIGATERRVMTKLIALLAVAAAVAAGLYFWRRNEESWESGWSSAKDSTASWGRAATDQAGAAADRVAAAADSATNAASNLAEELKRGASRASDEAGKATDSIADAADSATKAASELTDEVKEKTS
jgi:hypothetical protein